MDELNSSVERTIKELKAQKLIEAIEVCESDMFSKISKRMILNPILDMAEVQNVLICHNRAEQYTVYNLPVIYPDELLPTHIKALQEFEKLYA
jgi:hypothetical protein